MNLVGMISLVLFLVVLTLAIGVLNPAFAIFPACLLFLIGVGLFFRPVGKGRIKRSAQSPKPLKREPDLDGPDFPRGYSRVSRLDEAPRAPGIGSDQRRRDEDIGADVRTRLAADPALRSAGIEAESRFGRVTLVGRVRDEIERDRARAIAEGVAGVTSVSVQIRLNRAAGRPA